MATSNKTPQAEQTKKTAAKKRTAKIDAPQGQAAAPELLQLALADPTAVAPSVILALQRSHGNRAIQRLITGTQRTQDSSESAAPQPKPKVEAVARKPVTNPLSVTGKPAPRSTQSASVESVSPVSRTPAITPTRSIAQTKPVGTQSEPPLQPEPELALNGPTTGYVPPVAPPATPPPNGNKGHRVGSPYRHLDGVSNRKIQTKLTVGPARDKYEQEADAVADRVMRMTDDQTSRVSETREVSVVTRSGGGEGFDVDNQVEHQINSRSGSGNPLPGGVQQKMESRFGVGFGGVRVHTGSASNKLNKQLSAQAFTHGANVFFADGKYSPGTTAGQHLLAHELTHVVQQGAAKPNKVQRKSGPQPSSSVSFDEDEGLTLQVVKPSKKKSRKAKVREITPEDIRAEKNRQSLEESRKELEQAQAQLGKMIDESDNTYAEQIYKGFSSKEETDHEDGLRALEDQSDAALERIQKAFQKKYGVALTTWLVSKTDGSRQLTQALTLIRRLQERLKEKNKGVDQGQEKDPKKDTSEPVVDDKQLKDYALKIYKGFTGPRDEHPLGYQVLVGLDPKTRRLVADKFAQLFKRDLLSWLIGTVQRTPELVKSIAILRTGRDEGQHIDMAVALLPLGTQVEVVLGLLKQLPLGGRKALEQNFNEVFKGVGPKAGQSTPDTLKGYIDDDMDNVVGWDKAKYQRAIALLDHDLTEAEEIYLVEIGTFRGDDAEAVKRLQTLWDQGFVVFNNLEKDWARYVQNESNWTSEAFSKLNLQTHLEKYMTGQHLKQAKVIFNAYNDAKSGMGTREALREMGFGEDAEQEEENAQLQAARDRVESFAGSTQLTTNQKQIIKAFETIASIWNKRIARARKAKDEKLAKKHEAGLESDRLHYKHMMRTRVISMSASDEQKANLTLSPNQNLADQVYALKDDLDKLEDLVLEIWVSKRMNDLLAEALDARKDPDGYEVRPAMKRIVDVLHGSEDERVLRIGALTSPSYTDVQRGFWYLHFCFKKNNADSDLKPIYDFFATKEFDTGLKDAVIKEFVAYAAERLGAPGGRTPVQQLLNLFEQHFDNGKGHNFQRLRDLLAPPKDTKEVRDRAKDKRRAAKTGDWHNVTKVVADMWGDISGERFRESVDRSEDRLNFIATASPEQLKALMDMTGAKNRDELMAMEKQTFETRLDSLRSVENSSAQLVAGMVETLVEAGLGFVTGGVGWVAVLNSMAAAVANIYVQEKMLGTDFKFWSEENLKTVIQAGLSSALDEKVDLRAKLAGSLNEKKTKPFVWLEGKKKRAGEFAAATAQNTLAGLGEGAISSASALAYDWMAQGKYPTADQIAAEAYKTVASAAARMVNTSVTVNYNPGVPTAYTPIAQRLKNNVVFKVSVKVTQKTAGEVATALATDEPHMTLADQLFQAFTKVGKGLVSSGLKTATSSGGQAGTARGQFVFIRKLRSSEPQLYYALLDEAARSYHEGSDKLQQRYAAHKETGAKTSLEHFVLQEAQSDESVRNGLFKELLKTSSAYTRRTPRTGLLGMIEDDPEAQPPTGQGAQAPDTFNDLRRFERLALLQARAMEKKGQLPEGMTPEVFATRLMSTVGDQAQLSPREFMRRAGMMMDLMNNPKSPVRQSLLRGDRMALKRFLVEHGNWKDALEVLDKGGPEMQQVAEHLNAYRNSVVMILGRVYGAKPAGTATAGLLSDVDLSTSGPNAGHNLLKAEKYMRDTYGENWSAMFRMNFYAPSENLTKYASHLGGMSVKEKEALQSQLTEQTERYSFAHMLRAAKKSPKMQTEVKILAKRLGFDIESVSKLTGLDKAGMQAKREQVLVEIDSLNAQYESAAGPDKVALAQKIAKKQIEANFYIDEAYVGPGAGRQVVGGSKVVGHEAYQSALDNYRMFIEHSGEGHERDYEPYKYVSRFCTAASHAGVKHQSLNYFTNLGRHVGGVDRDSHSRTSHLYKPPRLNDMESDTPVTDQFTQQQIADFKEFARDVLGQINDKAKRITKPTNQKKTEPSLEGQPETTDPQPPPEPKVISQIKPIQENVTQIEESE